MEILEFGNKNKQKLIFINGFQSPHQSINDYIEYYKNDFHILVPILPGHNPNKKEEFISFDSCAKEIEEYFITHYGNEIYAIYGISMGGVLATHLWKNMTLKIDKLIIESSPILSYGKLITHILTKYYLKMTHKARQRDEKTIKQAVNTLVTENNLNVFLQLLDQMTDETIKNYIKEIGKNKFPKNISNQNTEIVYFYGSKLKEIVFKKIAIYISKHYQNSKIICQKGKGHCEDTLLNPKNKIKQLDNILRKSS